MIDIIRILRTRMSKTKEDNLLAASAYIECLADTCKVLAGEIESEDLLEMGAILFTIGEEYFTEYTALQEIDIQAAYSLEKDKPPDEYRSRTPEHPESAS